MSRKASVSSTGSPSLLPPDHPVWRAVSSSDVRYPLRQENSNSSINTVHRPHNRTTSWSSVGPGFSSNSFPLRIRNENVVPSRAISLSTLDHKEDFLTPRKASTRVSHKSSWGTDIPPPPLHRELPILSGSSESLEEIYLDAECGAPVKLERVHNDNTSGLQLDQRLSFEDAKETLSILQAQDGDQAKNKDIREAVPHPFRRWMSTLRRKSSKRQLRLNPREERWSLDDFDEVQQSKFLPHKGRHRKSSSWSSSGFVTAVKSAGISLTTLSTVPQSRLTRRSTLIRSSNRSSWQSQSLTRESLDHDRPQIQVIDEAALSRAVQRRKTLEELVFSEESYIADLKVLVNVRNSTKWL